MRVLAACCLGLALAAAEPYAAAELRARAAALALAEDEAWLTLLHVERAWYGVRRSLVDDPAFFLAPNGSRDPAAELDAMIAGLLAPRGEPGRHAVERFPARAEFLIGRLGLDPARLPVPESAELAEALSGLGARSLALAFPTAYMNTPASMFGHTLLVVRSRLGTGMAGQAINYAASTGADGGIAFALKGVFGGYPGQFSLQPYWQKLSEYADMDQRDVWEYELAFSPDEVRRLLLHVWEMRGIASDYYFFDENCSYLLLYLMDAARPGLLLHRRAPPWVIPLDTVRILREAGLLLDATWRPSLATRVQMRAGRLGPARAAVARDIALGRLPPSAADADPAVAAEQLDLAADWLQARRNRRKLDQQAFQGGLVQILGARARLGVSSREAAPAPPGVPPDQGHGSLRLGLSGGVDGRRGYVEARVRPAYHDLLDPAEGYVPGAQIEFAGVTGRWYEDGERPVLERLDAVTLRSITPWDGFFAPPSWRVDSGLVRETVGREALARTHAQVEFGVGAALALPGGMAFAMAHLDARLTDTDPTAAVGLGPELGAVLRPLPGLALLPTARWTAYAGSPGGSAWRLALSGSVTIHRDLAVVFSASRRDAWGHLATAAGLGINAFF